MKAMLLHGPKPVDQRPLTLVDVPDPAPGAGEVRLRVEVCGVCRTDLHQVEGDLDMILSPVIPGHQVIGVVEALGEGAGRFQVGQRIGVAWLHDTCGCCEFCASQRENLCRKARFTGWSVNGGYAERVVVPEAYAYAVPDGFDSEQAAPLMCAGIIGYRALRLSGVTSGQRLALYGFGGSAHITIQVARHLGCEVFVVTRNRSNRELAAQLGAAWAGDSAAKLPAKMHGAIIFAPAGQLVPAALAGLEKGGTVALAGIHMSPIPGMDYRQHLYDEKCLRSVANSTRRDGEELLSHAVNIPVRTSVRAFSLVEANDALLALKTGAVSGAAVLDVARSNI